MGQNRAVGHYGPSKLSQGREGMATQFVSTTSDRGLLLALAPKKTGSRSPWHEGPATLQKHFHTSEIILWVMGGGSMQQHMSHSIYYRQPT